MSMPAHSLHQLSQRYASGKLTRAEYLHQREMILDRLQANADTPPTLGQTITEIPAVESPTAGCHRTENKGTDCVNRGRQPRQHRVTLSHLWHQRRGGPVSMKHYVVPAIAFTLVVLLSLFLLSMLW